MLMAQSDKTIRCAPAYQHYPTERGERGRDKRRGMERERKGASEKEKESKGRKRCSTGALMTYLSP